MTKHPVETTDGWTCTVCGRPVTGYPDRDGETAQHLDNPDDTEEK